MSRTIIEKLVPPRQGMEIEEVKIVAIRQDSLVLVIDQSGVMGGAELSLLEVCQRMPETCKVALFSDGPFRERLQEVGVGVQVVGSGRISSVKKQGRASSTVKALWETVKLAASISALARSHRLIYANTQKAMVIGAIAGLISRRPIVWHLRDIVSSDHFDRLKLFVIKWTSKCLLTHVIANSQASADALQRLANLPVERISVVYNGIDSRPFDIAGAISVNTHRSRYGLPLDAFLIGSFSRLASWKGQHVLLDCIAGIPNAHAVLVGAALFGEEPYELELKNQAERLGIEDRVHFLGFQRDIPSLMTAVDVVVHTSIVPEPFGRVIVEAMLAKRAIVASAAGGVMEIIEDNVHGLLFPPGDALELQKIVRKLYDDRLSEARMVNCAYERARQYFAPNAYCDAVMDKLSSVGNFSVKNFK